MKIMVVGNIAQSLVNFRGPLLRAMVERGHDVVAVGPENDPEYSEALRAMGVKYRTVPLDRAGFNPIADLRLLFALMRLMRQERPGSFLGYTVKPVVYGNFAARLVGVAQRSALITGLGYGFSEGSRKERAMSGLIHMLYRLALLGTETVFFQNPDDLNEFLRLGFVDARRATLVAGSGVDVEHFACSAPPPPPMVFLTIARLLRAKGIDEYVRAARILKERYPEARFQLLGPLDSNPTAISSEQVEEWQREGTIEYLGVTRDVRPYLHAASVFVLPSYREGTPRTSLEALATGRPIVTTDVPGCRETVSDGVNGFLVQPRDVDSLAQAMGRFVQEPDLVVRMGAASRELAEAKFDVRIVNATMLGRLGL